MISMAPWSVASSRRMRAFRGYLSTSRATWVPRFSRLKTVVSRGRVQRLQLIGSHTCTTSRSGPRTMPTLHVVASVLMCALLVQGCDGGGDGDGGDESPTTTAVLATTTPPAPSSTPTPQLPAPLAFAIGALRAGADEGASVLRSEDGSLSNFQRVLSEEDGLGPLGLRVGFADRNVGWAIDRASSADSHIFRTEDSGATWTDQTAALPNEPATIVLNDITFVASDPDRGVAIGAAVDGPPIASNMTPVILTTSNGGESWVTASIQLSPERPGELAAVCFTSVGLGVAVGSSSVSGPVVLLSEDGGSSWSDITSQVGLTGGELAQLSTASCVDDHLWIGGRRLRSTIAGPGILHSADSGATWSDRSPPFPTSASGSTVATDFVTEEEGWAVALGSLIVFHTEDAGLTWEPQPLPAAISGVLTAIDFSDSSYGVVVGATADEPPLALIVSTNDGGTVWEVASIEESGVVGLNDVSVVP